jgi:hypothetical protein
MKTSITVKGIDQALSAARILGKEAPMAVAKALTRIATQSKKKQVATMTQVFDRPVPFVLNSLYVQMATPAALEAKVWLRIFPGKGSQAEKFLGPQIFGGQRTHKRFEKALIAKGIMDANDYAIPAEGADFDAYGNMRPSQIVQILSYLGAFAEIGYVANRRAKSKRKINYQYLYAKKQYYTMRPGIYKLRGKKLIRVMIFVSRPKYQSIFPFHQIGINLFNAEWKATLTEQIDYMMRQAQNG